MNAVLKKSGVKAPRRTFSEEFKTDAVQMVADSGGRIAKVARELNIYESTLAKWVSHAREQADGAPSEMERAEIRELRRELERVTRERDILGKAVAYFSGSHPKSV